MKQLLLLTILTLTSFNCFSQLPKHDIENFKVKGCVKSLKAFTYNAIDQTGTIINGTISKEDFVEGVTSSKKNFNVFFDTLGNMLQYDEYYNLISPWHTTEYIFTNERLTSKIENYIASDAQIEMKSFYKYDKDGNKIEESSYRNGILFTKIVFKNRVTANGKEVDELEYDYEGNLSRRNFKGYNSKGKVVRDIEYDSKGKEKSATLNTYNDKDFNIVWVYRWNDETGKDGFKWVSNFDKTGKVLLEKRYDLRNKLESIHKYKYNNDGLYVGGTIETPNGQKEFQYTYIYEGKKKVKQIEVDKEGVKTYKYNEYGDVIEYEEKTNSYHYEYTYDEKSNWMKIIEFRNTIPILIKERIIIYYDTLNKNTKGL